MHDKPSNAAQENMKPIREAEARIHSEDGLGFALRWAALPEDIRLQSVVASMNEFASVRALLHTPPTLPPVSPFPVRSPLTPPAPPRPAPGPFHQGPSP